MVRNRQHPGGAHLLEKTGRGVAAADGIVEQADLDPAAGGLRERVGETSADLVVVEDVHLHRDAGAGALDGREPGGKRLPAIAQQPHGVVAEECLRLLDVAEGLGRQTCKGGMRQGWPECTS